LPDKRELFLKKILKIGLYYFLSGERKRGTNLILDIKPDMLITDGELYNLGSLALSLIDIKRTKDLSAKKSLSEIRKDLQVLKRIRNLSDVNFVLRTPSINERLSRAPRRQSRKDFPKFMKSSESGFDIDTNQMEVNKEYSIEYDNSIFKIKLKTNKNLEIKEI